MNPPTPLTLKAIAIRAAGLKIDEPTLDLILSLSEVVEKDGGEITLKDIVKIKAEVMLEHEISEES